MLIIEKNLYIKILIWAYKRSEDGFTEEELFDTFHLNNSLDKRAWYLKTFKESSNLIIDHLKNNGDVAYWTLTSKGMSEAISYLGLKEAQKSGERAESIALWSIRIAVAVGVFQIALTIIQMIYKK